MCKKKKAIIFLKFMLIIREQLLIYTRPRL